MPHVVTQACCGDASCVFACPVNAIHPTPDEPDFGLAEMLYIDPVSCVDCGACVTACPVGAISAQDKLVETQLPFVDVNALFHVEPRDHPAQAPVAPVVARVGPEPLRVAIVGSGPAALYAADELLKRPGVDVAVFDRLPTPHGLVRAGVAPDHQTTKTIDRLFRQIEDQPGFAYALNVEVGVTITHQELTAHHHAVVYATGASADRRLGIEGEDLPGSATATAFVAWYNGHPDHADRTFDLDGERVVIIGTGNVSLDVARILSTDPERLATTDIADHALEALRGSAVREIVLLGRRGAAQAAFTLPELIGLVERDDIDIAVEGDDLSALTGDPMTDAKVDVLRSAARRPRRAGARRIVFRFHSTPEAFTGSRCVDAVCVRDVGTGELDSVSTTLVLRSIGYRGVPVPGVPFDDQTHTIPNDGGRVVGSPATYAVGWIKRGPSGFIGTNKSCAQETVDALISDANAGELPIVIGPSRALQTILRSRTTPVDLPGWRAIDRLERTDGAHDGRPRRKLVGREAMLAVVAGPDSPRRRRFPHLGRR